MDAAAEPVLSAAAELRSGEGHEHAGIVLLPRLGQRLPDEVLVRLDAYAVARPVRQATLERTLDAALRRAPSPAPAAEEPRDAGDMPRPLEGFRVLVAEDNVVNTKLAVMMLERFGCRVQTAGNGVEALAALARGPIDLVLMDCDMPDMDGFEATREIRRMEAGRTHTPIVAMTASAMEGDRLRCLEAGMDDYLAKPVRGPMLRSTLERWRTATEARAAAPAAPDERARAAG